MRMVTDSKPMMLSRRQALSAVAGACFLGVVGSSQADSADVRQPVSPAATTRRVAAAWDDAQGRHHIGILQVTLEQVVIQTSIEVPTRAHALAIEPSGSVLAIARRPGEWLLRWHPPAQGDGVARADAVQWHWLDEDTRFNGHVLPGPDGASLLTTETDLQTGAGLLVLRDSASMAMKAHWPTHGLDPHAMHWLPQGLLLVANGGMASLPETGRARLDLDRMDSSLVAMSPSDGRVQQTWRLADPRQSLRHLAWHPSGLMAVAMQAQHDDPGERTNAPVLALLDLQRSELRVVPQSRGMGGYAGDVAMVEDHWFVSGPRTDTVLRMSLDGSSVKHLALPDGGALAGSSDRAWGWASGRDCGLPLVHARTPIVLDWKPDNHAVVL